MIENFDYSQILSDLSLSRSYVSDIIDRTANNDIIAGYYERAFEEFNINKYFAKSYAVANCGKSMLFDFHNKVKIADLIRVQLCKDRNCPNCQKLKQIARLHRYMPFILDTTEYKKVHHLVLTAPNVSGEYLSAYVTVFYEAFRLLVRILRGTDKISDIDFKPLEFSAVIRNTEITYGRKGYHLHLHCIIAVNPNLRFIKNKVNKFSFDYDTGHPVFKRYFSDFEIFMQKIWRLLVDRITATVYPLGLNYSAALSPKHFLYRVFGKDAVVQPFRRKKEKVVTLDKIRSMGKNGGYSVILDDVQNEHFVQLFKYAFKVSSEDNEFMSYENFLILTEALFKKHAVQGYGDWYRVRVSDDETIDDGFDDFFDVFKAYLWQIDRPNSVNMSPEEVLQRMHEGEYTFITRSKLRNLFVDDPCVEKLMRHKDEFSPAPKSTFSLPNLGLAYDRYLRRKQESNLFNDLQKIYDTESGQRLLVLSEQQLNFLSEIF